MKRLGRAVLGWLVLGSAGSALAEPSAIVHVVRAGDTLTSIARDYYGEARRAAVLRDENGLGDDARMVPGMRLGIPYVQQHRVAAGDTWQRIAERYYGSAERAFVLMQANDAPADAPLVQGALVRLPYPLRHVVHSDESLASLAGRYYGDRRKASLIRAFNGGHAMLERGQLLLIPLLDLTLSPTRAQRLASAGASGPPGDELALALSRLGSYVQTGRFVEAVALGNQLLEQPLAADQQVTVQRELATSYVALGRVDLATAAFSQALAQQPELGLDPVRTSPRVLAAFEAAKHQQAR